MPMPWLWLWKWLVSWALARVEPGQPRSIATGKNAARQLTKLTPMPTILKPRNPKEVPHGSFIRYKDPDSGMELKSPYYTVAKSMAVKHRRANNYPIGINWDNDFDENICRNTPHLECVDLNPNAINLDQTLTLGDIVRGTHVIASLKLSGGELVPHKEAEDRAAICAQCPHNVPFVKPCKGICEELRVIVAGLVGGASTSKDHVLYSCAICRCYNAAQVHVPLEHLRKGVTPEMDEKWPTVQRGYGFNCWKAHL